MAGDEEELPKTIAESGAMPGSLHHEMPGNGGQSQSLAEPESTSSEPATAEPSGTAPPEPQPVGEPRLSMDEIAAEVLAPGTTDSGPAGPTAEFAPPPKMAGEQTKQRSLFFTLAATAVAGAILGMAGTFGLRYLGSSQSNGSAFDDRIAALNARIDATEGKEGAAAAASRTALSAVETRVAAAENAAIKAVESANSVQADVQKIFESRSPAQEPVSGSVPAGATDLGPLEARIGTLEQKLAPIESALAARKPDLRAEPDRDNAAAGQVSHSQAIAVVVESLLRNLDGGGQFSGELAALENLGVPQASLAPLRAIPESTVLSERQLAALFANLAPAITASESAKQAGENESFFDRLTRNAKGLVHIRRVGAAEASDVQGLMTRIANAIADHDLEAALKAWNQLPSAAISKSENWGEAAKARLDALNAAKSIEAGAVAVLGKPKS